MAIVECFTFNPFQENTYIVSDETKECVIVDPGCYSASEQIELIKHIESKGYKPVKLLNTHCHVDHVLGNKFVAEKYKLELEMNELDLSNLTKAPQYAQVFGVSIELSPLPGVYLNEGDVVKFGKTELSVLFTPGHSAGSICFYSEKDNFIIAGDVLFNGSIGRTDLPGGDYATLINSIKDKLMDLPDSTVVHSGHGPYTTIGHERNTNPFLV